MDSFANDWRDNPDNNPKRTKAPYNSYVWNRQFSKHYPTPESFWDPKNTRAYKYTKDKEGFDRKEAGARKHDDRKYARSLDAADRRPLHRKGSLNRAFDESLIRRVIRESIEDYDSLYGDFTYSQIRNMLGDYGDDELNLNVDAEQNIDRRDQQLSSIVSLIKKNNGIDKDKRIYGQTVRWDTVIDSMSRYGFDDVIYDDDNRDVTFKNYIGDEITVCPKDYYNPIGDYVTIVNLVW